MGFKWAGALDWSSAAQRRVGWQLIGSVTLAGWGLSVKLFFFFFSHWGGPLGHCMHYWARGWPLCSLEECTNRSSVSRELHAHVCTVQAWNTLFRAGVAFSHSVFLFTRSLRNLERIIPTFQTPTSQKAAVASRDQSQEEREPTSLKWDGKFLYRPQLNAIGWLCTVPETD